jgi:hypothetical protein
MTATAPNGPAVQEAGVTSLLAKAMDEARLQANVTELCKVFGLLVYHTHDSRRSPAGFPDLVIVGPGGVLFRELKAMSGRITRDQMTWLAALEQAGANASVWRPMHWLGGTVRWELSRIRTPRG